MSAEPIVVEDLMRILARAKRAVAERDVEAFKHAQWDLEAIERPESAHGWDTTKVALYAMHLLEELLHPPTGGLKGFYEIQREVLDDLRERQAYFDAKRARQVEYDEEDE